MNIWTFTTDSDSGTDCQVFYSEAAANDAAKAFLTPIWQRHYSDAASVPEMPVDWRDAWEVLSDSSEDWLTLQCHTITDHPAIARVLEALAPLAHLIEQPEADTSLPLDVLWKIRDCTWSAALRLHGNDISAAETALSCAVRALRLSAGELALDSPRETGLNVGAFTSTRTKPFLGPIR